MSQSDYWKHYSAGNSLLMLYVAMWVGKGLKVKSVYKGWERRY